MNISLQIQNLEEENTSLNNEEYRQKKIRLKSYPQAVFVQIDGPCNHNCLFCSRPEIYNHFDLDDFRSEFEDLLFPVFQRVNRINITGSGELLFLPEAKRNLSYFNQFKQAEKMFATNGSSLTPKMVDYIIESENRYLIHVSLHASNPQLHSVMTANKTYDIIFENIKYLSKAKEQSDKLQVNFIFVATTRNISDLLNFIRFAYEFNADGVVVYYHYIYRMDQKEISCYFNQEQTNNMISLADKKVDRLAKKYGKRLKLVLPPMFGREYKYSDTLCNEAWNQVMINSNGDIISCDVAGDSFENISGKKDFMEVWNGKYYTELRKNLVENRYDCASFCFRANPNTVNKFKSHVISRGKTKQQLAEFLKGT